MEVLKPTLHKRRSVLGSLVAGTMLAPVFATGVLASDVSGELVIINWLGGSQGEMMQVLEDDFTAKTGVTVRNVVPQAGGDARGGIRAVLLGGETADLLINTWPAFRKELIDSQLIVPVDDAWASHNWSDKLSDSWKNLSTVGGSNYGVTYTFGDRSGIWYRNDTMAKAGITPPETWEEYLAGFDKLNAAGINPVSTPAKVWAHAEWFESILLRSAGADFMAQLAAHEVPWTSPEVAKALGLWAEMIEKNCCDDANTMLATAWDSSVDAALKTGDSAYVLMGMWLNTRAKSEYGETPGEDYNIVQFPAMGMGHDNESMVDAKEFNILASGENRPAAEAFIDYMLTADASKIMAEYGLASPSSSVDPTIYDPVVKASVQEVVSAEKLQFVLGDLLPGDLGGEYRVQLQKFLQDPSAETIAAVGEHLEQVAQDSY